VASAEVDKSWPDRIVIRITERVSELAVAMPSGGYDLVDTTGVVVRWVAQRPARFPLLQTPDAAASLRGAPSVSLAVAVLGELPPDLRSAVKSVAVADNQVTATLATGISVMWGGADRPDAKAQVLSILMRTHARYYDVSAPGFAMTSG
jgi:cell division protein FtsQ